MIFQVESWPVLDGELFDGRRNSVQNQSFVKCVCVAEKGYWPIAVRCHRVFPEF